MRNNLPCQIPALATATPPKPGEERGRAKIEGSSLRSLLNAVLHDKLPPTPGFAPFLILFAICFAHRSSDLGGSFTKLPTIRGLDVRGSLARDRLREKMEKRKRDEEDKDGAEKKSRKRKNVRLNEE